MTEALREEGGQWKCHGGEGVAEDVDVGVRQKRSQDKSQVPGLCTQGDHGTIPKGKVRCGVGRL